MCQKLDCNWCKTNIPEIQECGQAIATSVFVQFEELKWVKGSLVSAKV